MACPTASRQAGGHTPPHLNLAASKINHNAIVARILSFVLGSPLLPPDYFGTFYSNSFVQCYLSQSQQDPKLNITLGKGPVVATPCNPQVAAAGMPRGLLWRPPCRLWQATHRSGKGRQCRHEVVSEVRHREYEIPTASKKQNNPRTLTGRQCCPTWSCGAQPSL